MNSPQELRVLIDALRELQASDFAESAALATITQTHGSTFRRAGTSMLVFGSGRIICELAGGCPQRDIVFRAQQVMAEGVAQLVHYNRDANYDVLIELGCGGELDVLIEPVLGSDDLTWLDALEASLVERRIITMATVFADDGSTALPRPRRLLCHESVVLFDGLENPPLAAALSQRLARLDRRVASQTHAGFAVLLEQLRPLPRLVMIGANIGLRAMVMLGLTMGWQTSVVDNDLSRITAMDLPDQVQTLVAGPATIRDQLTLDDFTAVVVMTHRYELDLEYLNALGDAPLIYVGAIGSRDRARRMRDTLNGPPDRLHAPAGLDIGSETPQEIALAVTAEIVATFNARDGRRLSQTRGPIHG